jgi:hypothetical protein
VNIRQAALIVLALIFSGCCPKPTTDCWRISPLNCNMACVAGTQATPQAQPTTPNSQTSPGLPGLITN